MSEAKSEDTPTKDTPVKDALTGDEEVPQTDKDGNPIDAEGNPVRTSDDPQPDFGASPDLT
jgi:hypothetical protein